MEKIIVTGCNGQLGRAINAVYADEVKDGSVTLVNTDFGIDGIATLDAKVKRVQYIPYNVFYTAEYYLKDLEGDGYTLKESQVFEANMGQIVTPPVKTVDGWIFEKTESVEITEENQKVPVYYTRANYTLHYDTDGGSYIEAVTAPFESVISVSTTKPAGS